MKRFLFCIVMLFCMCMAMNAQRLKTYSGPNNDSRYMSLDVPQMGACREGANHVWNQLQ